MPPASHQTRTEDNRRYDRRKTLLSAKVSTLDSLDDCVVRDLSSGGAEISTLAGLQINQKVTLEIPRLGPAQGRVVWSRDRHAGIQFMAPLDEISLSILAQPHRDQADSPAASPAVKAPADGNRAELESRLVELARDLSRSDLEIAIEQIAVLARHSTR